MWPRATRSPCRGAETARTRSARTPSTSTSRTASAPAACSGYAPDDGWVEFVTPVTADELLWTGLEGDREGVPDGTRPLDELDRWVGDRPVRRLGAEAEPDAELRDALIVVRRPKDDIELERMRTAARRRGPGSRSSSC